MQDVAFIGPVADENGFDEVQERGFSGSANACEDFDDVLSDKRGDLLDICRAFDDHDALHEVAVMIETIMYYTKSFGYDRIFVVAVRAMRLWLNA
ncbi:hypothetical protein GCM10008901_15220 [Bifidobacterium pullorum]